MKADQAQADYFAGKADAEAGNPAKENGSSSYLDGYGIEYAGEQKDTEMTL